MKKQNTYRQMLACLAAALTLLGTAVRRPRGGPRIKRLVNFATVDADGNQQIRPHRLERPVFRRLQ